MTIELIYWDSATFLAHFQSEKGRVELCAGTLARAKAGEVCIVTSALALAECLWLRNEPPVQKARAEIVRKFFRHSYIRVRNVTRSVSESAQDLVWDHGVRPKDAIHVATALEAKVLVIETFDKAFIAKSGLIGTPPIIIREPIGPAQKRLDLQ
jgi:hypothetical protein